MKLNRFFFKGWMRNFCSENKKLHKVAYLDDKYKKELENGISFKKISSFLPKESLDIPSYLDLTAKKIIKYYKRNTFNEDVNYLKKYIKHSSIPVEETEIQYLTKELEIKEAAKDKCSISDYSELSEEKKLEIINDRYKRIYNTLKSKIENRKEINYDDYTSVVYMASRLNPNYIVTRRVFNEIKLLDPTFKPQTLFDFGSGLGTTMHVANEVWPASIFEHFNVDLNDKMNNLSNLLLRTGNLDNEPIFNNVFYRQYLPLKSSIKYDLVVSAFCLKELPNVNSRINTIENLWQKTKDILVIIEHGNKGGTSCILEARSFLLQLNGYNSLACFGDNILNNNFQLSKSTIKPKIHIMAPCSHHYCCPLLKDNLPTICNFSVNYLPTNYNQNNYLIEKEKFSYIVLRKKCKENSGFQYYPRIVSNILKGNKAFKMKICNNEGNLENIVISKGKCDKDTFSCAKKCKLGDVLPIKFKEIKE